MIVMIKITNVNMEVAAVKPVCKKTRKKYRFNKKQDSHVML